MLVLFFVFYRLENFGDFIFIFILTPRLYNFKNFLVNQKIKKWWPKQWVMKFNCGIFIESLQIMQMF